MAIHNDYPHLFTYVRTRLYDLDIGVPGMKMDTFTVFIYDGEGYYRENYAVVEGQSIEHCFGQLDAWAAEKLGV